MNRDEIVVFDRRHVVARHELSTVKGSTTLVLDHCLEILARKARRLAGGDRAQPASPVRSLPRMRRSGRRLAAPTVIPKAPVSWWRCYCCTATSATVTWWPG